MLRRRRYRAFIFAVLAFVGCSTRQHVQNAPNTSIDARSIANVYLIASYGTCGAGTTSIQDGGDCWIVGTVYGLGERQGPELRIDKYTLKVTPIELSDHK